MNTNLYNAITGFVCGDACGVPYEFKIRDSFKCTDMRASSMTDAHLVLPLGSWSDDTSMMLCVLHALMEKQFADAQELPSMTHEQIEQRNKRTMQKVYSVFKRDAIAWMTTGKYTNHGYMVPYDVGNSCRRGITAMMLGRTNPKASSVNSNGNGGLMRILPLAFAGMEDEETLMKYIKLLNKDSHNHEISHIGCLIYTKLVQNLQIPNISLRKALENTVDSISNQYKISEYDRIWDLSILDEKRNYISSTGYVVHTLEAAIWACAQCDNYKDAIITAVNLGEDTDTVAALAGGIAGVYFGNVPEQWIRNTRRAGFLRKMCDKFEKGE
ncbi:MAG: ADP-ribosylglycohydrolase family protein [Bacteroidaceae bacterium]|nr:ADP-ribosylglycohydrolase family protein [Bacteroidaceae bacterium]